MVIVKYLMKVVMEVPQKLLIDGRQKHLQLYAPVIVIHIEVKEVYVTQSALQ